MEQQQRTEVPTIIRRRASSRDVLDWRAAKAVVGSTQPKLAQWHRRVAFLKARAQVSAFDRRAVQDEAGEHMALVIAARVGLEGEIADAGLRDGQHSLVRDVLRSLQGLQAELEKLSVSPAHSPEVSMERSERRRGGGGTNGRGSSIGPNETARAVSKKPERQQKELENTDGGGHLGGTHFGQTEDAKTKDARRGGDKARKNDGKKH